MNRYLLLAFCSILMAGAVSAQTTNSAPFCTPGYKNPAATTDMTTSVNVNSGAFTNSSGIYNNSTYVYYNNLNPIVMQKGSTNTIVISGIQSTIGTSVAVWLDWNKDDSFDFFNEQMDLSSLNFSPMWSEMLSFVVPMNADTGIVRMRLMSYGSDNATSIVACPSGGQTTMSPEHGEAEDYRVRIVAPTGIEPPVATKTLVYPNPASDILTVKPDETMYKSVPMVRLHDICGQEVLSEQLSADGKMNISSLPGGSYFLTIMDGGLPVERMRVQVRY